MTCQLKLYLTKLLLNYSGREVEESRPDIPSFIFFDLSRNGELPSSASNLSKTEFLNGIREATPSLIRLLDTYEADDFASTDLATQGKLRIPVITAELMHG